jgi:maleate isomerase
MYGYRGRLGLIVPSSNTTNEPEFAHWAPKGVSIHATRMHLEDVTPEDLIDMGDDVEDCADSLRTADVDAVAFGCTTGSLVKGKGYDEKIQARIEERTGAPAVATSTAVMTAFDTLNATSLAIGTPYTSTLDEKEMEFLEDNGYHVERIEGLGLEANLDIGTCDPSVAYRLAKHVDTPDADAVFLSCTNFRTFDVLANLEADLGKPVVSSNGATLWAALGLLGVDNLELSLGRLYERSAPSRA